jgi:peptidoglycan hydrolase-like protein with peptidoglycan-binding domain
LRLPASKALIVSVILVWFAGHAPAQSSKKSAAPSKQQASNAPQASSKAKSKSHRRRSRKGAWKSHGQQGIQAERATAIQEALIREKYLTGEPTGQWDARTEAAMARYQADHGWQSKVTPDSRALIKLGLGPDYSDKNMMLFVPKPAASEPVANSAAGAATTSKQQ